MLKRSFRLGRFFLLLWSSQIIAATHYVDLNSSNAITPYSDWSTAATNIQDAIDASVNGDQVLVTNGIYQTGGRVVYNSLTNRVVINKAITLQSVNGPAFTLIQGNSILSNAAVRCVFMISNSVLNGFTLTNGGTLNAGDFFLDESGGGVWTTNNSTAVISNCILIGNVAAGMGGGAYNGVIRNCSIIQNSAYDGGGVSSSGSPSVVTNSLILSNSAAGYGGGGWGATFKNCKVLQNKAYIGGGAEMSSLIGCLVASNSASESGGAIDDDTSLVNCTIVGNNAYQVAGINGSGFVENCIVYDNTATIGSSPNYSTGLIFYNSCTMPLPANGANNITNDPEFVNFANGDFHLQSNSPCINSGNNLYINIASDLDGNPRIIDGLVDSGAYEYQTAGFILPYYWAQQYGLPLDGTIDSDGDGMNNWQEAVAGTNPTNALSVLKLISISKSGSSVIVDWQSVANKIYYVQRSTNLANSIFTSIYTNPLSHGTTSGFLDGTATNSSVYFYRIGVQ